jgi:hypothetical protein
MSTKGRLTRQELGWLLTQEAAGAAERLRTGVQVLRTKPPPPSSPDPSEGLQPETHVEASLDALDDVMRMLSNLHSRPSAVKGRRGRIDLAAVLWEIAPEARVQIEPGSGTEVFGDEGELRRMLHVLVGHGSGLNSEFTVRRDGDDVRVSVVLGPDSSATAETERAWLSRMAIRFGGRLELEGGSEVLILPADNVSERNEREALRKELDEARKQGEAYARELAAVFAQGEGSGSTSPSTFPPMEKSADRFATLAQFAGGIASELRSLLLPIGRDLQSLKNETGTALEERTEQVRRRFLAAQDFVAGLAALGELDPSELPAEIEFVDVARTAIRQASARAERGEVALKLVTIPEGSDAHAFVRTLPRCAAVLARELVLQAVAASPRASEVVVAVVATGHGESPELGLRLTVDDAGAPLPASARRALLSLELDPGTYARPSAVPLFICAEIASATGALLELADAPSGGLRVSVTYPR